MVRAGARWLGVTSVEEGIEARLVCPEARILVIGGVFPGQGHDVVRHKLTAVLGIHGNSMSLRRLRAKKMLVPSLFILKSILG